MNENVSEQELLSSMYDISAQQQRNLQKIMRVFSTNVNDLKSLHYVVAQRTASAIEGRLEKEIKEAEEKIMDMAEAAKNASEETKKIKKYTNKKNFLYLFSMCLLVVFLVLGLLQYETYKTKSLINKQKELKQNINKLEEQGGNVKLVSDGNELYVRVNRESCAKYTDGNTYCLPE